MPGPELQPESVRVEYRPELSPGQVIERIRELYGLSGELTRLPAEWDQNFRIGCGDSGTFVVKIANRGTDRRLLAFQNAALDRLAASWTAGMAPRVVPATTGYRLCDILDEQGNRFPLRLLTWVEGTPLSRVRGRGRSALEGFGRALGELDRCLEDFQHPGMDRHLRWDLRRAEWIGSHTGSIADRQRRGICERILLQYRARTGPRIADLPATVIHNDANDENVLVAPGAGDDWRFAGLVDFGDMLRSATIGELAIACAYTILGNTEPLQTAAAMTAGYHHARPLAKDEIRCLFPMICMRLCVSVTISAMAAVEDPENRHRQISDRAAWEMLEQLARIDWRDAETRFRDACGVAARPSVSVEDRKGSAGTLLDRRRQRLGPSLRLVYREPLEIVRGRGQFLFDQKGRAYLDCVNNICHVGHCHPRVIEALSRQAALLNSNTRYLHPLIVEYAERLTATMPEPLRVCYFVNSGSEANELAVRIARNHTGREDLIVVEDGYHGNSSTLVGLSPYKALGPGGRGLADTVHMVPKPDPYRGPHRGMGETAGRAYAEFVRDVCARLENDKRPPALFLCESILGCGGQIVPPDGYLREAFRHVRAAGGLCLVDEVQVGFGRVGTHMWAFQAQGVIPDLVTLGKPMGNGHPIGAVITTAEIARSFATGMEFFSSFGGNPVSAAVGLAVLDVIEAEGLRERAARVGDYLVAKFRDLAGKHPQIGDVRGAGLFLGVELVRDHDTLEPATEETADLIERVKAASILLGAEGPLHNVLKIKPPLQFAETDADLVVGAVDRALAAIFG